MKLFALPVIAPSRDVMVAAVFGIMGLGGCTTVTAQGAHLETQRRFGVIGLAVNDQAATTVIWVRGFGLVPGRRSLTLGYRREVLLSLADADNCRIVILADRSTDLSALQKIIDRSNGKGGNPCVFTTEGRRLRPASSQP